MKIYQNNLSLDINKKDMFGGFSRDLHLYVMGDCLAAVGFVAFPVVLLQQ